MPKIPKQLIPEYLFYSTYIAGEGQYSDEKPIAGGKFDIWRFRSGEPAWQDTDQIALKNKIIIITDPFYMSAGYSIMLKDLYDSGFSIFVLQDSALIEVQPLLADTFSKGIMFLIKDPIRKMAAEAKDASQTEFSITTINQDKEKIKKAALSNKWQVEGYIILDYVEIRKLSTYFYQFDIKYLNYTENMFSMDDLIGILPEEFRTILMHLDNITGLNFNEIDECTFLYVNEILKKFSINSIKISSTSIFELTKIEELFKPNQLEHLDYSGEKFDIQVAERFVALYPNLKTVSLTKFNSEIRDKKIISPILNLIKLQNLTINSLILHGDPFADFNFPKLISLTFEGCISDSHIYNMPLEFSQLKTLNVISYYFPLNIFKIATELVTLKMLSSHSPLIEPTLFPKLHSLFLCGHYSHDHGLERKTNSYLQCHYPIINNLQLLIMGSSQEKTQEIIEVFAKQNSSIEFANGTYRYFDKTGKLTFSLQRGIYPSSINKGAADDFKSSANNISSISGASSTLALTHEFLSDKNITSPQVFIDLCEGITTWPGLTLLPKIESFGIFCIPAIPNKFIFQLFEICPNLIELYLPSNLAIITDLKILPKLQYLHLSRVDNPELGPKDAKKLLYFLEKLPNLITLDLIDSLKFNKSFEDFLKITFENLNLSITLPKLRQMKLSGSFCQIIKYMPISKTNVISIFLVNSVGLATKYYVNLLNIPLFKLHIAERNMSFIKDIPKPSLIKPHILTMDIIGGDISDYDYLEDITKLRKIHNKISILNCNEYKKEYKLEGISNSFSPLSIEFNTKNDIDYNNKVTENFPKEDLKNIRLRRNKCYKFNPEKFTLKEIFFIETDLKTCVVPRVNDANRETKLDDTLRQRTLRITKNSKGKYFPIQGLILNEKVVYVGATEQDVALTHDATQDFYYLQPLTNTEKKHQFYHPVHAFKNFAC